MSDLPALLPLFRAYQDHYQALTSADEAKTEAFLAGLLQNPAAGFVVVADVEKEIVGFATGYHTISGVMAERLVHLGDLYVAPGYRRLGIATALVNVVTAEAAASGVGFVRWLSVASNTDLNRWYDRLGGRGMPFQLYLRRTEASS